MHHELFLDSVAQTLLTSGEIELCDEEFDSDVERLLKLSGAPLSHSYPQGNPAAASNLSASNFCDSCQEPQLSADIRSDTVPAACISPLTSHYEECVQHVAQPEFDHISLREITDRRACICGPPPILQQHHAVCREVDYAVLDKADLAADDIRDECRQMCPNVVSLDNPKPSQGQRESSDDKSKQLTVKERNRVIQRRYRERQKGKLHASEVRIAELTQQLHNIQLERKTLSEKAAMLENLLTMQQAPVTQHLLHAGDNGAWWLDAQMMRSLEAELCLDECILSTVRPEGPVWLRCDEVVDMSSADFQSLWKLYVDAFAELLIEAGGDPNTAPGRRLVRLVHESDRLKMSLLIAHPDRSHYNQIKTQSASKARDVNYPAVVDTYQLTAHQKSVIVALWHLYLRNLGLLRRRRQTLTAQLQELPGQADLSSGVYSQTVSTMDALRNTLRDEHICQLQFVSNLAHRVVMPMQLAHVHVINYPGHGNANRLAELLAKQAGEPPASQIIKSGVAEPEGTPLVPLEAAVPECMRRCTRPEADLTALYPHLPPEQLQPPWLRIPYQRQLLHRNSGSSEEPWQI